MYCYEIIHIPGKFDIMKIADIMLRNTARPDPLNEDGNETAVTSSSRFQSNGIHAIYWQDVKDHTPHDTEATLLAKFNAEGFPDHRNKIPPVIRAYWPMRDDLYLINGVPFKGKKMLIPKALRTIVLEGLHTAHQGVCWPTLETVSSGLV